MNRIIIITGKGGVGKSSVAASHAVKSAKEGAKTLLVSTDMAHNIADIFQVPVGGYARPLMENLYGLELDPDQLMKEEFQETNRSIASMIGKAGFAADKMSNDVIFPGFDDLFSLLKIGKIYESGEYERIIVDCAPTGETLALLKLPELLSWYMEKFFPVGKAMVRVLKPISKYKYHVDLPSTQRMNDIEKMHHDLIHLQDLLKNQDICSVRLVTTPEKMVVEETKRNYMYMNLYGYGVDGLFINRVLPEDINNEFFEHWREIQSQYIEELERVFLQIPKRKIPWFPKEVRGMEAVEKMANCMDFESVYGDRDSESKTVDFFAMNTHLPRESYIEKDGKFGLILEVPGVSLEDLEVSCHGMDVDVSLGNFQRRIPLPNVLRGSEISSFSVEDGKLFVFFQEAEENRSCES